MASIEIFAETLDDLAEVVVSVALQRPDGLTIRVKLRALPESEVRHIRRSIAWPEPPVGDFQRIAGQVTPIYNYQDKAYQLAVEDANAELAYKMMLAGLQLSIPGETDADKLAALKSRLGQYAFTALLEATNRLNITSQEDIAAVARSFRAERANGTASHVASEIDAQRVAELIEGGADDSTGDPAMSR